MMNLYMKYEITQGQYCDFLNTIASAAAVNCAYIVNTTGMCHIAFSNIYYGNYPDRAMPFMSYNDLLSYLDWAALRPMTELEFEKHVEVLKILFLMNMLEKIY